MKIINGIIGAPGISIANVFILKKEKIDIIEDSNNIDNELKVLEINIKKSNDELEALIKKTKDEIGDEEAEVFHAHILMLNDPVMSKEVKQLINDKSKTAVFSIQTIFDKYISIFDNMDDKYMKERAVDIEDVKSRLINNILNISPQKQYSNSKKVIIVSEELTPSDTVSLNTNKIIGMAIEKGGATSHATIIAKTLGIPAVVGLTEFCNYVKNDDLIILDANKGSAIINPNEKMLKKYNDLILKEKLEEKSLRKFINIETKTKDGYRIHIECNVGGIDDAKLGVDYGMDGIGLFRTEFSYMNSKSWPSEHSLYESYKLMLQVSKGKLVTFRTLDIGGDKVLPYYKFEHEDNPFLGQRSIRFSLNKKDIFITQLRALIRASNHGRTAIMFPMIATIDEFNDAKKIYDQCYDDLKSEGYSIPKKDKIQVGMMMEVPAAAIISDKFAKIADFFSIGSNDLIQYSMAADRLSEKVRYLYQPTNLSILRLLNMIIQNGNDNNIRVAVCGEIASNLSVVPLLLGMGLKHYSVSPRLILKIKRIISETSYKEEKKKIIDYI